MMGFDDLLSQIRVPENAKSTSGICNFICQMRVSHLDPNHLFPLVLVMRGQPPPQLLRFMAMFPYVYYAEGDLNHPDRLLHDCISRSHAVVLMSG